MSDELAAERAAAAGLLGGALGCELVAHPASSAAIELLAVAWRTLFSA